MPTCTWVGTSVQTMHDTCRWGVKNCRSERELCDHSEQHRISTMSYWFLTDIDKPADTDRCTCIHRVEFCMGDGAVKSRGKTAGVPRQREERPPFIPRECWERDWLLRESRRTGSKRRSPPAAAGVTPGSLVGLLLLLFSLYLQLSPHLSCFLCSMIWTTYLVHSWRWPWPLLHTSSCNMDRLNQIFNFVFLSYWLQRDRDGSGSENYGTGSGSYGSGTGAGLTTAGPGQEWEWQQRERAGLGTTYQSRANL